MQNLSKLAANVFSNKKTLEISPSTSELKNNHELKVIREIQKLLRKPIVNSSELNVHHSNIINETAATSFKHSKIHAWSTVRDSIRLLASHPECSVETITLLSTHHDYKTRVLIASNNSTELNILKSMITDEHYLVRRAIARNPKTTIELLDILSEDDNYKVRCDVALNAKCNKKLLKRLFLDEKQDVRADVVLNPNVPLWILENASWEKSLMVRLCVAQSQKTPKHILERLMTDENPDVVYAATWSLKIHDEKITS